MLSGLHRFFFNSLCKRTDSGPDLWVSIAGVKSRRSIHGFTHKLFRPLRDAAISKLGHTEVLMFRPDSKSGRFKQTSSRVCAPSISGRGELQHQVPYVPALFEGITTILPLHVCTARGKHDSARVWARAPKARDRGGARGAGQVHEQNMHGQRSAWI